VTHQAKEGKLMDMQPFTPKRVRVIGPGPGLTYWEGICSDAMLDDPPCLTAWVGHLTDQLATLYAKHGRDLYAEGGVQQVMIPTVDVDRYNIPNAVGLIDIAQYEGP
jgi:hypothetical protein